MQDIDEQQRFIHDLANPLTVVRLNLDLLEMNLANGTKVKRYINVAQRNLQRVHSLLKAKQLQN